MLNIQADAFYAVENPADNHIVSVQGPYASEEHAQESLRGLYQGNPGAEQIVYPVLGKWLIEEADVHCTEIDPVQ